MSSVGCFRVLVLELVQWKGEVPQLLALKVSRLDN